MSMRAFLALTPDGDSCLEIEKWSRLCWPGLDRAVAAQNYHITLAFLGDITESQLRSIEEQLDESRSAAFSLVLSEVGYWPDSRALWLGPSAVPTDLEALAGRCTRVANRAGVKVDNRRYRPHLTLARKTGAAPAQPLMDADFPLSFDSIELYESLLHRGGVRYRERRSWPLRS